MPRSRGARPCGIAMAEIAAKSRIGGIERPPKKKIVLLRCAPGSSISPKSSSTPLWRTLPSQIFRRNAGHAGDKLADFAAVFRNRVRVRAKASAPAPAGRERGGSRLVGGRFSFFGRWRDRLAADRRNVVSACRTASRTIGKTPRPTLRAGEHAWNSTGAQAGKYGIPMPIPPSTCCSRRRSRSGGLGHPFTK